MKRKDINYTNPCVVNAQGPVNVMTNKEFAGIIKMAKDVYKPYTGDMEDECYMCHAVQRLETNGIISFVVKIRSLSRIQDIIHPYTTLECYIGLISQSFPTDEELVAFWDNIIEEWE